MISEGGSSESINEVSRGKCKRRCQKNTKSHNCNGKRIVSRHSKHRASHWPRPAARSICGRISSQASRAAVVTVYLAENTTRSLEVFDLEEPQARRFGDQLARLGPRQLSSVSGDGGSCLAASRQPSEAASLVRFGLTLRWMTSSRLRFPFTKVEIDPCPNIAPG